MEKKMLVFFFLVQAKLFSIPEPYQSIKALPVDMHGGAVEGNRKYLTEFIKNYKPKIVVEIGTWLGVNAFFMAHQLSQDAKLYVVDPWIDYEDTRENPWYYNGKMYKAYWQFLSNCIHENLTDKIVPIRMTSVQASNALDIMPDLIYIDGAHDEESVCNDILAWYPKIKYGGICCGDDWRWESVRLGVKKAATQLNLKFYNDEFNFWYFLPK